MMGEIYENLIRLDIISEKLENLHESKSWQDIALALYGIIDDIDTADDMCKENSEAFRNIVMKLQVKKNQYMHSLDGYKVVRVDENEEMEDAVETLIRNELQIYPDISKDELFQNVLDGVKDDIKDEVKQLLSQVYNDVISHYFESKLKENLTDHAQRELKLAGLFDDDSDYNGMLGEAVLKLIELFAKQGHSGMSAAMTRELFNKLATYKPLTEITDDVNEWGDVTEYDPSSGKPLWQSRRNPSLFSNDKGKTYWDIDEEHYMNTDEDGKRWFGGLSKDEWDNRPMHTSKHKEVSERKVIGPGVVIKKGDTIEVKDLADTKTVVPASKVTEVGTIIGDEDTEFQEVKTEKGGDKWYETEAYTLVRLE